MAREWRVHPDVVRANLTNRQLMEMQTVLEHPSNTELYIAWSILNTTGAWVDNSNLKLSDFLLFNSKAAGAAKTTAAKLAAMFNNLFGKNKQNG